MPRYEYRCSECGVRFERVQRFDEAPVLVCPECDGEVHRLIGPVGVVFKGSGFYSTDHRKGSEKTSDQ
jgi:putative FmdB family regulatory protein